MNAYDELPYDSHPCAASHPDLLAAVGRLFGLQPAPVTGCRVLELGCGTGANLVPLAAALPGSQFVGIDLSPVQIDLGRRDVAELGLKNCVLEAGDLAALPATLGKFDYVLAHGVFSWVSGPVQEALLAACRACLTDEGIAYVSYCALPGGRQRQALRDMLRWAARGELDPREQVARARSFAAFAAGNLARGAPAATALRRLLGEVGGMSDAYLLHDYLSEVHEPLTLSDFVDRARGHRLQYLGDAQLPVMFGSGLDEEALVGARAVAEEQVAYEQALDFLEGRSFRTTLLCREECAVDRQLAWQRLDGLLLTTRAKPLDEEEGSWSFRAPGGEAFGTDSPLVGAALTQLADAHPRPLDFRALCDGARGAVDGQPATPQDAELVGSNLIAACASGQVELASWDHAVRNWADGRLEGFAFARLQAGRKSPQVTNLWHREVELTVEQRDLLLLLDGTRSREELVAALGAKRPGMDEAWLDELLAALAENALLVERG